MTVRANGLFAFPYKSDNRAMSRTQSTDELSGLAGVSFQWARFRHDHPRPDGGDAVEGYRGWLELLRLHPLDGFNGKVVDETQTVRTRGPDVDMRVLGVLVLVDYQV